MSDTQKVFQCPQHGLLRKQQVQSMRCKLCGSHVSDAGHMRVELVKFDREVTAMKPRPQPRGREHAHL